jgi:NTP pyrophosphatase (non-canonical NTP hydrolase)
MEMNDYQRLSRETAIYPTLGHPIVYPALGLAGEAGEVAEKVKKAMRDDGLVILPERKELIKKELGDVLWYVAQVATEAGLTLEEIAWGNYTKLKDRQERGVIQGNGDNR